MFKFPQLTNCPQDDTKKAQLNMYLEQFFRSQCFNGKCNLESTVIIMVK